MEPLMQIKYNACIVFYLIVSLNTLRQALFNFSCMNSFYKVSFSFFCVSFFCSSCATIFNGTKQEISIDSKPQGATVKVKDKVIGTTPLFVKLPTKKPLDIVFTYQGYEDRTYFLDHKYEWRWLLLDVPATFPYVNIPFAIDVMTQSPYRFVEKKVMMNFDSVYVSMPIVSRLDSAEAAKRLSVDRQLLEIEREMAALKREERRIFVEEERKRKLTIRKDKIRAQWLLDSTIAENKRRSYDSSRAHNYRNTVRFKNSVTLELSSLLIGESRLEYHRNIYKGISLGIEIGYKPAYYSSHTYTNQRQWDRNGPSKEIMVMPFTESYYIGLATKIPVFDLGRGKYYISFVSFIRNSSFDHGIISWRDGDGRTFGSNNYKDSVGIDQNSYGLKILFGFRKIVVVGKIGLEFDTYAGLSCRNVTTQVYHYETTKTEYYYGNPPTVTTDEVEKIIEFVPTVQMGVKVGVRF
ncbi:MAG: putative lipoprotein [Chitinophagaceae bacterium]|nr:putative lipoprotein [Chitinophagaceae bacterium]